MLRGGAWQSVGRRGGLPGLGDPDPVPCRGFRGARSDLASGVRSCSASCSARTSFCPSACATTSGRRACTTYSPSLGPTLPFSPSGSTVWMAIARSRWLGREAHDARGDRLVRACRRLAAVGDPRWGCGRTCVARAGSSPDRAIAGTSLPSERSFCLPGRRPRRSSPASQLPPFAAVAAIFVGVPRLRKRLEGYPLPSSTCEGLAVAIVCGLVTAPIVLLHFWAGAALHRPGERSCRAGGAIRARAGPPRGSRRPDCAGRGSPPSHGSRAGRQHGSSSSHDSWPRPPGAQIGSRTALVVVGLATAGWVSALGRCAPDIA